MARVRRGNRQSLEMLVQRYSTPLLTFLTRMSGDRHVAEEIFQEVFLIVWSKRKQFDGLRTFRPWLFTVAANRCREEFRKKRPEAAVGATDDATNETSNTAVPDITFGSPVQTAIQSENARLVAEALEVLPESQRTVVSLRIWNSLSFNEIAEIVDSPVGTVRSHMSRGLQALKHKLEPVFRN